MKSDCPPGTLGTPPYCGQFWPFSSSGWQLGMASFCFSICPISVPHCLARRNEKLTIYLTLPEETKWGPGYATMISSKSFLTLKPGLWVFLEMAQLCTLGYIITESKPHLGKMLLGLESRGYQQISYRPLRKTVRYVTGGLPHPSTAWMAFKTHLLKNWYK